MTDETAKATRDELRQAEQGDVKSAEEVEAKQRKDPATTEAVVAEESEAPGGRGLSR